MTHLRIEQNTITENVTSNVIHKLYETAKAIIDAEEANDVQESLVSLKGNLLVTKAYGSEVTWLENKFPDLHINVTVGTYISFEDAEVERLLKTNYPNVGDGIGFTQLELYGIGSISGSVFYNSSITKFNELLYFNPLSITGLSDFCSGCTLLTEVTLPVGTDRFRSNMFAGCTSLTTIRNTEGITTIETGGIGGCSSLLTINLPNLTTLGNWACNDTGLRSIDLSNVTSMGRSALASNSSLTSVGNLNPSFTTIPQECFKNCTSLASIDLSNVTSIGESAFEGCTGLTSIDLSNVTTIGSNAFNGCTGLTTINLSNCTSIGSGAFRSCSSLTSVILGSNITNIPEYAFGQSGLTSVSSNYVTTIGRLAFWGCPNLHSVDFPNVTSINDEWELVDPTYINMPLSNKLPGLSGTGGTLTEVVIPQSVTELKNNWAWYYNNLQSVKFQTAIPPTLGTNIVRDSVTIYVPSANLSDYQTAYPGYSSLMIGY